MFALRPFRKLPWQYVEPQLPPVVPPVILDAYNASMDAAKAKSKVVLSATFDALGKPLPVPPVVLDAYNASLDAATAKANSAAGAIGTGIPAVMALIGTSSTKTAATVATTLPPVLLNLSRSPAPRQFATNFQGSMNTMVTAAHSGISAGEDLYSTIEALHSKDIWVTTHYQTIGKPPEEGTGTTTTTTTTPRPGGRQYGGLVTAQRPMVVGEAGPELFVPQTSSGYVMSNADTRRLIQALEAIGQNQTTAPVMAAARGGDTIIINDRLALAAYYDQRRRGQLQRSNDRMGG